MSPGHPKTSPKLTPLLTLTWAPVIRPEVSEAEKALGLSGVRARLGWDRAPNAQECSQICAWLQGPPPGSPLIPLKASQTGLRGGLPCGGAHPAGSGLGRPYGRGKLPLGLRAQQPTTRFLAAQGLCPGQQLPREEPGLGWCTPSPPSQPLSPQLVLFALCSVSGSSIRINP